MSFVHATSKADLVAVMGGIIVLVGAFAIRLLRADRRASAPGEPAAPEADDGTRLPRG